MAPLHRVYFLGNVIQDPEAWSAPNGTAVARWGLAVPTRLRQGDTWHEDVCCIEVLAFGRQADTVKATLRPGCTVLIEGRVQWWRVAQGGSSRHTQAVIAERIQCLSRPQEASRPTAGGRGARRGARSGGRPSRGPAWVRAWRVSGWLGCGHQGDSAPACASAQDAPEAEQSGAKTRGGGRVLASLRRHGGPRPASHVRAGVTAIETQDIQPSHAGGEAV